MKKKMEHFVGNMIYAEVTIEMDLGYMVTV